MTDFPIPPEVVEAMRTAAEKVYGTEFFNEEIEAAARAMLAAWPGVRTTHAGPYDLPPRIILPLPQEPKP